MQNRGAGNEAVLSVKLVNNARCLNTTFEV